MCNNTQIHIPINIRLLLVQTEVTPITVAI